MAKNYNHSDYALNKFSESIVYYGADGAYELTRKAFLASDPSLTEADYEHWKRISDDDHLATVRRDTFESKHTVPLEEIADTALISQKSTEDVVLEDMEPLSNPYTYENALRIYKAARLTEKQASRYEKYYIDGMSVRDIAVEEGVYHKAVVDSISQAEKKIKNFLSDSQ